VIGEGAIPVGSEAWGTRRRGGQYTNAVFGRGAPPACVFLVRVSVREKSDITHSRPRGGRGRLFGGGWAPSGGPPPHYESGGGGSAGWIQE